MSRTAVKRVLYSNPRIFYMASHAHRTLVRGRCLIEKRYHQRQNTAPVNPLEIIYINPGNIRKISNKYEGKLQIDGYYSPILNGEWDQQVSLLSEYDLFYSIIERIQEGLPWEETDYYNRVVSEINETDNWYKWGCRTIDDFEKRCQSLDELAANIKSQGYQTQRDLKNSSADPIESDRSGRKSHFYPPEMHEITINIGRDGELILNDGRHRLAITKAVGIKQVPVRVAIRHTQWQEKRNQLASNGSATVSHGFSNHPDIVDIL